MTMDKLSAVSHWSQAVEEFSRKVGELAEVKKAELQTQFDNFIGENVTAARENSRMAAVPYAKERIDLEADIEILRERIKFYHAVVVME